MLGIVTEATVRLIPKPQAARVIIASFDDVVAGGEAVANVIAAGIIPAGLEMMDRTSVRMVEPFVRAGYDTGAAAILLCESDGMPAEVDDEIERMSAVLRDCGATSLMVSRDDAERLRFWSGRKNAFPLPAASRPITIAWTAPSRASIWRGCCSGSRQWKFNTACAAPTCFMRDATCIR